MNRQRGQTPASDPEGLRYPSDGMIGAARRRAGGRSPGPRGAPRRSHTLRAEERCHPGRHRLRALADDPELTCRLPGLEERSPVRIVLDRDAAAAFDRKLATFGSRGTRSTGIAGEPASDDADRPRGGRAASRTAPARMPGPRCLQSRPAPDYQILLEGASPTRGLSSLIVEGGAAVAQSLSRRRGSSTGSMLFTSDVAVGEEGIVSRHWPRATMPSGLTLRRTMRPLRRRPDLLQEYEA